MGGNKNEACLIYVTFDGRIFIYHNIKLAHVQTFSLIDALDNSQMIKQFMSRIGMDGEITPYIPRFSVRKVLTNHVISTRILHQWTAIIALYELFYTVRSLFNIYMAMLE